MKKLVSALFVVLLSVVGLSAPSQAAVETTLYVANSGTTSDGPSSCENPNFVGTDEVSLQAALDQVAQSNASTQAFSDVGFEDLIAYSEILICPGTWTLTKTLIADANVVIRGSGYSETIINGNSTVRLFQIGAFDSATEQTEEGVYIGFAARVKIQDLTLKNGYAAPSNRNGYGGAILVQGRDSLHVSRVYFVGNQAVRGAALEGLGNAADNLEGIDYSPSGDIIVESSAFENNAVVSSGNPELASVGIVELTRYNRNAIGAVLRNNSFNNNYGAHTANFDFSNGQSLGNSFVDNDTNGTESLYGGETILVHGNVFAQNDATVPCNSQLVVGSDSVSTALCGTAPEGESPVSVFPYASADPLTGAINPLGIYPHTRIPVQRFREASAVRGIWPSAEGCLETDALGDPRPIVAACDAGPLQQQITEIAPQVAEGVLYRKEGNSYVVQRHPATALVSDSVIRYSTTNRLCQIDERTGSVTRATSSGTCFVTWRIFTDDVTEEATGTETLHFSDFPVWQASMETQTALHHQGNFFFVTSHGVIDRLSASGIYKSAWVTLPANIWGAYNTSSAAIGTDGTMYVSTWDGKIAKISPAGFVDAETIIFTEEDIVGLTVTTENQLLATTCDDSDEYGPSVLLEVGKSGEESKLLATLPSGWCPSYLKADTEGSLLISGWNHSGMLRVYGTLVTEYQDSSSGRSTQLATDKDANVYSAQYDSNKIAKLSKSGIYLENWLTLPLGCLPSGIAAYEAKSLFVACAAGSKVLEVGLSTQEISTFYENPDLDLRLNQIAIYDNQLAVSGAKGFNLRLSFAKPEPLIVSQTTNVIQEPTTPVAKPITPPVARRSIVLLPPKEFKKVAIKEFKTLLVSEAPIISAAQIRLLGTSQLRAIPVMVFAKLKPKTVAAISATKLKALTGLQKKALTKAQVAALSRTQKKAVGR